jgi:hypothetical protein
MLTLCPAVLGGPEPGHRAVEDDRGGQQLAAGEYVADLRHPHPLVA